MIRAVAIGTAVGVLLLTTGFSGRPLVMFAWAVVAVACVYNVVIPVYDWVRGNPPRWPRDMTDW